MTSRTAALVACLALAACTASAGEETTEPTAGIRPDPDLVLPLAQRPLSPGEEHELEDLAAGDEAVLRAAAAAVLWAHDPEGHWPTLRAEFAVRDHAQRAAGEQELLSRDEFTARLREIEARHAPSPDPSHEVMLLVSFVHLRNANLWIATEKVPRLSLARFFRSAFLTTVVGEERAVAAADRLDREARAEVAHDGR